MCVEGVSKVTEMDVLSILFMAEFLNVLLTILHARFTRATNLLFICFELSVLLFKIRIILVSKKK